MCHAAQYAKMVLALAAGGSGGAGVTPEGQVPPGVCEATGVEYTLFIASSLCAQLTVSLVGAQR
jgi:hypothetical protein